MKIHYEENLRRKNSSSDQNPIYIKITVGNQIVKRKRKKKDKNFNKIKDLKEKEEEQKCNESEIIFQFIPWKKKKR